MDEFMKAASRPIDPTAGKLTGKVAWVTGAGRGLGRAVAVGFARAGAAVAVTSRSGNELEALKTHVADGHGSVLALEGSVTDSARMRQAAQEIGRVFGRLDILVNSAGISPAFTRAEELSDETWLSIIDTNLSGTFICCREAGRMMLEAGAGSIINISSVHASKAFGRLAAYTASKGGVEALTRALAVEWAQRGVRVNCIAPGYFVTPLSEPMMVNDRLRMAVIERTPQGRLAMPEELVSLVTFLASDESSFVTGSTYSVDGGWAAT